MRVFVKKQMVLIFLLGDSWSIWKKKDIRRHGN